jgi:hypothetical protein
MCFNFCRLLFETRTSWLSNSNLGFETLTLAFKLQHWLTSPTYFNLGFEILTLAFELQPWF